LDHKNNYIKRLSDNAAKSFNILAISLNVLHNYFDSSNKIILKSVSKVLDTSAKPFFSCSTLQYGVPFFEFIINIEIPYCL